MVTGTVPSKNRPRGKDLEDNRQRLRASVLILERRGGSPARDRLNALRKATRLDDP